MVLLTLFYRKVFNVLFIILNSYEYFKIIESSTRLNSVDSFKTYCSLDSSVSCHPFFLKFYQFSSIAIEYPNLGFNSSSLVLLVPGYVSCRSSLHHTIVCKFHYSPFFTKFILLEMRLVCFVSLPFLDMHIADLISNIIRCVCS